MLSAVSMAGRVNDLPGAGVRPSKPAEAFRASKPPGDASGDGDAGDAAFAAFEVAARVGSRLFAFFPAVSLTERRRRLADGEGSFSLVIDRRIPPTTPWNDPTLLLVLTELSFRPSRCVFPALSLGRSSGHSSSLCAKPQYAQVSSQVAASRSR